MNEKTFKAETMTTPATDKQIRTIIDINTKFIIKDIQYPATKFFSKAHAIIILEQLFKAKDTAEKRPYDRDMYYKLYDRFAAKYPKNNMAVPVRDYHVNTDEIPDNSPKPKHTRPTKEEVNRFSCNRAFRTAVMRDFMRMD